jgi:uncharacterized protein YcfJ
MKTGLKVAFAISAIAMAAQSVAQVTFYENNSFQGKSFTTQRAVRNFETFGFNDRASSVVVSNDRWEVCENIRYSGKCAILRPGNYPSLTAMGLNNKISSVRSVDSNTRIDDSRYAPAPLPAQVTFFENNEFQGRSFTTGSEVWNFSRYGFNDRASSVVVIGEPWEVCQDVQFSGRCVVLRPGRYASLTAMGLNDRISSVRAVNMNVRIQEDRYAPTVAPLYDSRRRNGERLFEANVTSVRAVVGPPEQRCWVEREQVAQTQGNSNVPAAIAGALIGGILGHQVGGGTGKDLATVGGVIAGGAIGANVGRDGNLQQPRTQNVQRCTSVPSQARPELWDVTYNFEGQEHHVQMSAAPGTTVTVNRHGEPRT